MKLTQPILGAAVLLLALLSSCSITDLRPEVLRQNEVESVRAERGRELLERALEAAGGRLAWESYAAADLQLTDNWQGFVGTLFRPWPDNPTRLQVRYDLDTASASGTFIDGVRKGETWGYEGDSTWSQSPGRQRKTGKRGNVRFIFAAYQYFFELAPRIASAPIVLFAGSRRRNGRDYDLVFVTWGKPEPHSEHDQYLLWIAAKTGQIEIAEYTIRDKFDFATGVNFFSDFRRVDGIVLPHTYRITRELDDEDFVHSVHLTQVKFLTEADVAQEPELPSE